MMGNYGSMMNNYAGPIGWMSFGLGWILMILFWLLLILGVVALIKWLFMNSRSGNVYDKSPLETLKERYARGEIDKKEFEDKKKDLA